jgi:hypothetical protein
MNTQRRERDRPVLKSGLRLFAARMLVHIADWLMDLATRISPEIATLPLQRNTILKPGNSNDR